MNLFSEVISNIAEVRAFLQLPAVVQAGRISRSVLVQIYASHYGSVWIDQIAQAIHTAIPQAVVVGASSGGEIVEGRLSLQNTVVCALFFESSEVHAFAQGCVRENEFEAGRNLAEPVAQIQNLQGVYLLAPPTQIDCVQWLEGFQSILPEVAIFGGGATNSPHNSIPCVFLENTHYGCGCVAVALSGKDLHIVQHASFGWKALGSPLTLTQVNGLEIFSINDLPAIEIYNKYLSILPNDEDIYMLEIPLLVERQGLQLARNPVAMNKDGSVKVIADVHQGETAYLGYLDIDTVLENTRLQYDAMKTFAPEAILLFSCVCRLFTLQQDIELEFRPFQALAPTAGFFTHGEICCLGRQAHLLNSSQILVALREGPPRPCLQECDADAARLLEADRSRFRHAYITSRLFHSISVLTSELEKANRKLQYQADHDALTGVLNRRALAVNLENELARSQRYGHSFSILSMDLDHFKLINDTYGHGVGDRVLIRVAETIRKTARASDSLYRCGGEEFALLMPESLLAGAVELAERIRRAIAEMNLCNEQELNGEEGLPAVTCSIGIGGYPLHGKNTQAILSASDKALYRAKHLGRNCVVMASATT